MLARISTLALALSTPAIAGDVRIEVTGTVVDVQGVLPAPFQGAAVGDSFDAASDVIGDPVFASSSRNTYALDLLRGFVQVDSVQSELDTSAFGLDDYLQLSDNIALGDTIEWQVPALTVAPTVSVSLFCTDFASSILTSPDVHALVGQSIDLGQVTCVLVVVDNSTGAQLDVDVTELRFVAGTCPRIGDNYCDAVPNSSGRAATMTACGSLDVQANDVTLAAYDMPVNAFGYFLVSRVTDSVPQPGGSVGTLCLGGSIGRYVAPQQIQFSGINRRIFLFLDLTQVPTPTGFVAVAPGDTYHFTAWYRDFFGGSSTSNFADGITLTFQ